MGNASKLTRCWTDLFVGSREYIATGTASESDWRKQTSGGGTVVAGTRCAQLDIAATTAAQVATLHFGDKLAFDIDEISKAWFIFQMTCADPNTIVAVLGMGSAYNTTPDSIAAHASFRIAGSTALVVESDDGTNDKDDIATGVTGITTNKMLVEIDFASGIQTFTHPASAGTGKSNVKFFAQSLTGNDNLRQVARNTQFNMSNYTSGLQPFIHLQKTGSGAETATLKLYEVGVEYKIN